MNRFVLIFQKLVLISMFIAAVITALPAVLLLIDAAISGYDSLLVSTYEYIVHYEA